MGIKNEQLLQWLMFTDLNKLPVPSMPEPNVELGKKIKDLVDAGLLHICGIDEHFNLTYSNSS